MRMRAAAVAAFLLLVPLVACTPSTVSSSGTQRPAVSGSGSSASATSQQTVAPSPRPTASPAPAAELVSIRLANFAFIPATVTVLRGSTLRFRNEDPVEHTATEGRDGIAVAHPVVDLRIAIGATGSFTFARAGTYRLTCLIHPTMNMTVVVR